MRHTEAGRRSFAQQTSWVTPDQEGVVLADRAREVSAKAYAPYSKFRVGSAVRSTSGHVYVGCNVENVSYPIGVCAERNALAAGVAAEGPSFRAKAIAVIAIGPSGDTACSPCGACRQAILELGADATVYYRDLELQLRCEAIQSLLPGAFTFGED